MTDETIVITLRDDKPTGGMWHCGPNPCWITATHTPTGMSVTLYSGPSSQRSQFRVRNDAVALLGLALQTLSPDDLAKGCDFPEAARQEEDA